jgi:hypothetical protein
VPRSRNSSSGASLRPIERPAGAVLCQDGVVVREHLVHDPAGHFRELSEDLVREQGARHHRRLLEGAGERGACLITRRKRQW